MNSAYKKLEIMYNSIKEKLPFAPEVALILGSGLGDFADRIEEPVIIPYSDIDGFPRSTVAGHKGQYVIGRLNGVKVVCMQGRVHYYEGYDMQTVVTPLRLMKMMGAKIVLLTNAAGGISPAFKRGDLMGIYDHITSFVPSPLIGENIDEFGPRFPDMSEVYSSELRQIMKLAALKNDVILKEGVYIQVSGPNYETPYEIKMYKKLGADAVGMSTACEAMAAKHAGMEVCGVSCITNLASGISQRPLSHEEVQQTADLISERFARLILVFLNLLKETNKVIG